MLKIFQKTPTIVVQTNNQILKIFSSVKDCSSEYEVLVRSKSNGLILSSLKSGEVMGIVDINYVKEEVLALSIAQGRVLSKPTSFQISDIKIAAQLLSSRHEKISKNNGRFKGELLGDFVPDHLYWDENSQKMTLIDPGNNYLVYGDLGEDCARFMLSIATIFRWRLVKSITLVEIFLQTYINNAAFSNLKLEKSLKQRYIKTREKYHSQKTPFRAFCASIMISIHYIIILCVFKKYSV